MAVTVRSALGVCVAVLAATVVSCSIKPNPVVFERLSVESVCYGECSYSLPYRLPSVIVYSDGRVRVAKVESRGGFEVALLQGRVPATAVSQLGELAAVANLAGGESRATSAGVEGISDGGGRLFSVRVKGKEHSVEAPHLEADSGRTKRRDALRKLFAALQDAGKYATDVVAQPRVALVARNSYLAHNQIWHGSPLLDLPVVADKVRCAVLQGEALQLARRGASYDGFGTYVTDRHRSFVVRLRPLLDHERSCADLPGI